MWKPPRTSAFPPPGGHLRFQRGGPDRDNVVRGLHQPMVSGEIRPTGQREVGSGILSRLRMHPINKVFWTWDGAYAGIHLGGDGRFNLAHREEILQVQPKA